MTKKSNSFKNIISVLLALLLLGIAAGPASAAVTVGTITSTSTIGNTNTSLNFSVVDGSNTTTFYNITLPGFSLPAFGANPGTNITSNVANSTTNWTVVTGATGTDNAYVNISTTSTDNITAISGSIYINISNVTIPIVTNTSDLSKTITVTTNGTSGTKTFARTVSSVNTSTTTLANISISKVANNTNTFELLVTAKDYYGNVVNGVTFTGASNRSATDTVTVSGATNATGKALVNVTSTLAGRANITATSGTQLAFSTNVVFVAGPASKLAFFGPNSAAGTSASTPGTSTQNITVQDANSNNVTSLDSPIVINMSKVGVNSATFPSGITLTISNSNIFTKSELGIAYSSIFTSIITVNNTVVETATIRANPNATFSAIQKSIQFFGPVTKLAVTLSKSALYANNSDTLVATAQLQDASSNDITTAGISITLASDNASLLTVPASNTTDADGKTTFIVTAKGIAGSTFLTAIDSNGNSGDSPTVTLNQAPHLTNSVVVNNTAGVILTGENSTITATIKDYANTVISGQAVTFNITTGDATFSDGSTMKTVSTESNGNASVVITSTNASTSISVNVTIVDETGATKVVSGAPQTFSVSPSAASQFSFSPSANIGLKNVAGTSQVINITVKDSVGNLNTTADGTINITTSNSALGNMSNGTTVNDNLSVTLTNGNATFTYMVNSSSEGVAVLTLTESTLGIVGTITITTSGAKGIALTVNTSTPQINGWVTAYAQLTDASGAALSISGTNIGFNVKNAANVIQSVSTNATNESGIAVFNFTQSVGGVYTVTASNATLSNSTTVTFAGVEASIVVTKNISAPAVNQTVTINATIKDANGVTSGNLNGQTVTFLADGIMFGSAVTISDGVASTTYTKATAGTVTITAFYNATLQGSTTINFGGPETPELTTITVSPTTASVVVNLTTSFTAVAKDQNGDVMADITVSWLSSNTTVGTISSTGVFTAKAVGTTNITATSGIVSSTPVTVTVTATSVLTPVVAPWDADNNGKISKAEALAAVANYFTPGGISKADALEVVAAYFTTNAT